MRIRSIHTYVGLDVEYYKNIFWRYVRTYVCTWVNIHLHTHVHSHSYPTLTHKHTTLYTYTTYTTVHTLYCSGVDIVGSPVMVT